MATTTIQPVTWVSRTNSLGWAKSPCQNCTKSNLLCDRSRPRCSTCIDRGILCQGYKLDLNWQSGIASRGNLAGFSYPTVQSRAALDSSSSSVNKRSSRGKKTRDHKERQFRFVAGRPIKHRKSRKIRTEHQFECVPTFTSLSGLDVVDEPGVQTYPSITSPQYSTQNGELEVRQDTACLDMTPRTPRSDANLDVLGLDISSGFLPMLIEDDFTSPAISRSVSSDGESNADALNERLSPSNTERSFSCTPPSPHGSSFISDFQLDISPSIVFGTLDEKFQDVLFRYDQYICAIPLTVDCRLNPFRIRKETSIGSRHLLHAVLATSLYHLTRDSELTESSALMNAHRAESLHLYSRALSDPSYIYRGLTFLDTTLLLMCLDSAQSAVGLYHIHLQGVRSILEAAGGGEALIQRLPKLRAQLAMFIWYDTTIAMISREPTMLPITYLDGIISHGRSDGWDYVNLTGCREEFIIIMAKIIQLMVQHKMARENQWLTFDMTPVDEVEDTLRDFPIVPPSYDSNLDEEALDMAVDRYHCDQTWRNGLLLYIARVFRWPRNGPVPGNVRFLARRIIDHTRCMRGEVTYQKQTLLPMFLAGAESRREDDRDFIRGYCARWTRSCGFKMFDDVRLYLEEIWREQELPGMQDIWWATVIERQRAQAQLPTRPQVLLG